MPCQDEAALGPEAGVVDVALGAGVAIEVGAGVGPEAGAGVVAGTRLQPVLPRLGR